MVRRLQAAVVGGYVFRGNFPCDKSGAPILRWTTIRVENETAIEFSAEKSRCGELRIVLGPKTKIHIREFYEDNDVETEDNLPEIDAEPLMWRQTSPFELAGYKEAIMEAMYKGTKRNIESETDSKNVEVG